MKTVWSATGASVSRTGRAAASASPATTRSCRRSSSEGRSRCHGRAADTVVSTWRHSRTEETSTSLAPRAAGRAGPARGAASSGEPQARGVGEASPQHSGGAPATQQQRLDVVVVEHPDVGRPHLRGTAARPGRPTPGRGARSGGAASGDRLTATRAPVSRSTRSRSPTQVGRSSSAASTCTTVRSPPRPGRRVTPSSHSRGEQVGDQHRQARRAGAGQQVAGGGDEPGVAAGRQAPPGGRTGAAAA